MLRIAMKWQRFHQMHIDIIGVDLTCSVVGVSKTVPIPFYRVFNC